MSQNEGSDTCSHCKRDILSHLSHHSIAAFDGRQITISCHEQPIDPSLGVALRYVLLSRNERTRLEERLAKAGEDATLLKQGIEAELKRKFEAKAKNDAAAEIEKTRISLVETHGALVKDLKRQLKEAEGLADLLAEEKRAMAEKSAEEKRLLAEKLAESDRRSIDLQLQLAETEARLTTLKARHQGLKDRSLDMVRMLISMGTRVAVLEEKAGVVPKVDPERIFMIVMGEEYDDRGVPVDALRDDPTPIPPTAPKAAPEVEAAVPAPIPVQPTVRTFTLEDRPAASAQPAPASEEDASDQVIESVDVEAHGHELEDDESESDEAEDDGVQECSVCDKPATEALTFTKKDGTKECWYACNPSLHADEFMKHLSAQAKNPPKTARDVVILFTPID